MDELTPPPLSPALSSALRSERLPTSKRALTALLVVVMFALVGCRIDLDQVATPVDVTPPEAAAAAADPDAADADTGAAEDTGDNAAASGNATAGPDEAGLDALPVLGPVPGRSHWHAAYVVRVCDQVLDPFESADDPLGIHSHDDGLMHIHPFSRAAGFENATLDVFAEAMGFSIADGELTLPSGVIWRDGDSCDVSQGRVFVDKWSGPGFDGEPERIFDDLGSIRFEADREIYQIAFADEDSSPVVPPSVRQLDNVSAPIVVDEVWVDLDDAPDLASVKLWVVDSVTEPPCADNAIIERTRNGSPGCFTSIDEQFDRAQAIVSARAVSFNRRAAVELTVTDEFRRYLANRLRNSDSAALAIEVSGEVVYAIAYDAQSLDDDLLVIRGGLDVDAARAMARLFAI